MYNLKIKALIEIKINLFFFRFFVFYSNLLFGDISEQTHNNLTYSFFGETGETESAFTIAGHHFR